MSPVSAKASESFRGELLKDPLETAAADDEASLAVDGVRVWLFRTS